MSEKKKVVPSENKPFAQKHATDLAKPIEKLCGQVIAKGMVGILEHCCELQQQRDDLLAFAKWCISSKYDSRNLSAYANSTIAKATKVE